MDTDLSWVPVLVYTIVIIGTEEVAQCLSDPFGSDMTDLPIYSYWKQTKTAVDALSVPKESLESVVEMESNTQLASEADALLIGQ